MQARYTVYSQLSLNEHARLQDGQLSRTGNCCGPCVPFFGHFTVKLNFLQSIERFHISDKAPYYFTQTKTIFT